MLDLFLVLVCCVDLFNFATIMLFFYNIMVSNNGLATFFICQLVMILIYTAPGAVITQ
jgi:hypothetical protein